MRLYMKEKVFSWNERFTVKDENGWDKYFVEGELFSWGKKLHVYDAGHQEVAFIRQELFTLLPRYQVYLGDDLAAEIVKEFTFLLPRYSIQRLGWEIQGSFLGHDYAITKNGRTIVTIHKEWMTWGDCYELDIARGADEIVALATVLAIDCATANNGGVSVTVSSN